MRECMVTRFEWFWKRGGKLQERTNKKVIITSSTKHVSKYCDKNT